MKTRIFFARQCALSLAIAAAFPVWAGNNLPEVYITASRSEQALELAPIGASVILGEEIRQSGVTDVNEAVRRLGGVTGRSDLNGGREAILDLRGFGDAASNNVVVLVDGVRISENEISSARLSAISPEMVERIEIMRGGSSVLWGDGASAGVINVITRSGQFRSGTRGQVSVSSESFGGTDVRGDVQTANDVMAFSAQVRRYRTDGYRKNSQHVNDVANLSLEFGDRNTLKTRISFFSDSLEMRWPGALPLATALVLPTQTNTPNDTGTQKQERWSIYLEKELGSALFSVDIARRKRMAESFQDYGTWGTENNQLESDSYQLSPRLSWTKDLKSAVVSIVAGIDWMRWDYGRFNEAFGFISEEKGKQTSRAGYIRSDLAFSNGWRVNAGFRSEKFSHQIDNITYSSSLYSEPSLSAAELGLSYALTDQWSAFARAATSYRVANVDELRYLNSPLDPQKARDLEVGLRYRQQRTSAGVRVFEQRTENEIAYDDIVKNNINLDPVRRVGIEAEAGIQLSSQLKLSAVAQLLRAQIVDGPYAGSDLPLVPKSTVVVRAAYQVNPSHAFDVALRTVGSAPFGNDWTNSCSNSIPQSNFIDLGYRYNAHSATGWSAIVGVDNLLDKKTYLVGYTNKDCNAYNVYPENGRRVKVTASYRF